MIAMRKTFLLLIFLLAAIGAYFPVFGLHGLRAAVFAIAFVSLPLLGEGGRRLGGTFRAYCFLAVSWSFFGLLGILRVDDELSAAKEVLDICFYLGMSCVVWLLVGRSSRIRAAIPLYWFLAYLLTALVAGWELTTGQHLSSSYVDQLPSYALEVNWTQSTFGNPNNYAAFLVVCLPFVIYTLGRLDRRFRLQCQVLFISPLVVLLFLTGSRGGFLAFLIEIALLAYFKSGPKALILVISLFVASIYGAFQIFGSDLDPGSGLLSKLIFIESSLQEGGSFSDRFRNTANGIYMIWDSNGFGVGPQQFAARVVQHDMPYSVWVPNPHNFFLEVGSQYGLVVLGCLLYFIGNAILYHLRRVRNSRLDSVEASFSMTMVVAGFVYFIAAIENSSYISQPTNWLFLSTLLATTWHRVSATDLPSLQGKRPHVR